VKTLAFWLGVLIAVLGAFDIIAPAPFIWLIEHSNTTRVFCAAAAVRVGLGLVLILAAPAGRAPRALRVLGGIVLIAGVSTGLAGLLALERARAIIAWWLRQGPGLHLLTRLPPMAIGGFVAYACAPAAPDGGGRSSPGVR
jgi:hypothetical protein